MSKYIIIVRNHGDLNIDTKYYGPFSTYAAADEYFDTLPAISGAKETGVQAGCKFIQELTEPTCGN